jgi:hypothetical protein
MSLAVGNDVILGLRQLVYHGPANGPIALALIAHSAESDGPDATSPPARSKARRRESAGFRGTVAGGSDSPIDGRRCGRGYAAMIKAIRAARARNRHFVTVSAALADGFVIDGDDGLAAHLDAAEAARSGVACRPGDRVEYSIRLGGAAFDVTLATEPQVDDRHLLDGVAA